MSYETNVIIETTPATASTPIVTESKTWEFKINAIENDYNSRNLGQTYLRFVLSTDKKHWTRADKIVGAEELSTAAYVHVGGMFRSADRHSSTKVLVELEEGQYVARMNRGGKKVTALTKVVSYIDENGELCARREEVDFSSVRNANGNWDIKVKDENGRALEILPSIRD